MVDGSKKGTGTIPQFPKKAYQRKVALVIDTATQHTSPNIGKKPGLTNGVSTRFLLFNILIYKNLLSTDF